jgi:hypothetical protein
MFFRKTHNSLSTKLYVFITQRSKIHIFTAEEIQISYKLLVWLYLTFVVKATRWKDCERERKKSSAEIAKSEKVYC